MSDLKKTFLSVINFKKEEKKPKEINKDEIEYISWGIDNNFPTDLLTMYDTVPEHSQALDFLENLIIGQGLNIQDFDYWTVKKIIFDYILFGGFAIQKIGSVNKKNEYLYLDITKCRLSLDKKNVIISENWGSQEAKCVIAPLISDNSEEGVFLFKNNKSRGDYPRPYYLAAAKSIDTLNKIINYHNNTATNGFSPNVVINVHGVPTPEQQIIYEELIKEKFTGDGQKFILSFSDTEETRTTVEKLQDDNLDTKFKDLQLFLRDEIIIAHKLTSGNLIGVNVVGSGFNKIEYQEALEIFKNVVVKGFRNELIYAISKLTNLNDIQFLDEEEKKNITVNNNIEGGLNDE